jgi:predicted metalloprotease
MKTKEREFIELMKDRTNIELGLTIKQLYLALYPEEINEEKYVTRFTLRAKILARIRRLIKRVRKKYSEFQWLYPLPYRKEHGPVEYRYVRVRAADSKLFDVYLEQDY